MIYGFPDVFCPQESIFAIFPDPWIDGRTDRQNNGGRDKASYRDAWTHLKTRSHPRIGGVKGQKP